MAEQISGAKQAGYEKQPVIGHQIKGGIINIGSIPYALKHDHHRYNAGETGRVWGRDGDYVAADLTPIGYHLNVPNTAETNRIVCNWLMQFEEGVMPDQATCGVEVEGCTYDQNGTQLVPSNGDSWPLSENQHPELLHFMLETATGKTPKAKYPRTASEIAVAVAQTILIGGEYAKKQNKLIVYSSVPEAGDFTTAKITPHPYLLAFSPKVLESTLLHKAEIPGEVINLYHQIGFDIISVLKDTQILNWPVNALHVHSGVPQINGLADPRAAFAMAQLQTTEMAKILSFMLYNTRHCYGVDLGVRDVRSIMRRLLSTAHGGQTPVSAQDFIDKAILALEKGEIHSLPRHPWQSQHDRYRIRMDGELKTVESIDAAMNPDIRLILGWIYINQLMNVIGLEALAHTNGDESTVLQYLEQTYGSIMRRLPTLGDDSSYEHDLVFNQYGYSGINLQTGDTYTKTLKKAGQILNNVGRRYPALSIQATFVQYLLNQQVRDKTTDLATYFGINTGKYQPNRQNTGLVTDYKNDNIADLLIIQNAGSQLQANALSCVRDDQDLLQFSGIL